ncbi:MAG: DUF4364 family protein [Oscillospiraceae bacterium]|jgi:hypothetical protein|nr:DUF4364 family protein [Oscillospiraceae bacterium]
MSENYGFIKEKAEIKMLILFVMRHLQVPISMGVLTELTMCDEAIKYFDVTDCIAKLVKTKHIILVNGKYSLTEKGIRNGEALEKDLPYSVRKIAEETTAHMKAAIERDSMIKTNSIANDSGSYKVSLSLSDGIGDIISMELLAVNEKQATTIERRFRENAEKIYHNIIQMITD